MHVPGHNTQFMIYFDHYKGLVFCLWKKIPTQRWVKQLAFIF